MKNIWLWVVWSSLGVICIFTALDTNSKMNESINISKTNSLPLIKKQKLDIVIEEIETISSSSEPKLTVDSCEVTGTCTTPTPTTLNRFRIFRWRR